MQKNINLKISGISNGKTMILSNCAICASRKSEFMKKQETNGLLICLGMKTPLSKIPLQAMFCFECNFIK